MDRRDKRIVTEMTAQILVDHHPGDSGIAMQVLGYELRGYPAFRLYLVTVYQKIPARIVRFLGEHHDTTRMVQCQSRHPLEHISLHLIDVALYRSRLTFQNMLRKRGDIEYTAQIRMRKIDRRQDLGIDRHEVENHVSDGCSRICRGIVIAEECQNPLACGMLRDRLAQNVIQVFHAILPRFGKCGKSPIDPGASGCIFGRSSRPGGGKLAGQPGDVT